MRSSSFTGNPERQANLAQNKIRSSNGCHCCGQIAVVGIGPGSLEDLSIRARTAILNADVIVGYNTYLKLIDSLITGKKIVGTGMMQEIDRCKTAVEYAETGLKVAVVSSGDPGIYGMAGLILELTTKSCSEARPEVVVIPGISAVGAAAAILGAPLMHDFAVISLSDLLTPWEVIRQRAEMAAKADFVTALYNPKSHKRVQHIEEVRKIFLDYRVASTPVGIVRNATRADERAVISDLENFTKEEIDMFSIVIIGNSQTYVADGKMITPRGYKL